MGERNQQFESFEQWVNKASSWLTRHELYSDRPGSPFRAVCFDAKGRQCRIGRDFMLARDEDAFPVSWLWPDQIPQLKALNAELSTSLQSTIATAQGLIVSLEVGCPYPGDEGRLKDQLTAATTHLDIARAALSKAESEASNE